MAFDLSKFRKGNKKEDKTVKKDKKKGINTAPSKNFMKRFEAK